MKRGKLYDDSYGMTADGPVTGQRFVVGTANGAANVSVAGGNADGIAMFDQQSGLQFTIMRGGIWTVEYGAACGKGVEVMSDAVGRAVPYVAGAGKFRLGRCEDAAVNVGDIRETLLYEGTAGAAT